MQSDPGAGVPHTGGDDDAVWRDLVARLEEPDDAYMDGQDERLGLNKTTPPHAPTAPGTDTTGPGTDTTGPGAVDTGPKGVVDFDPLGVWEKQSAPAPREPAAEDYRLTAGTGPRDDDVDNDDDEFVPAELPSLSNADPAIMASWIGAAGGPLFLVFSAIFWRQIPLLLVIAVIMAFIAGTGYLFYRLPDHRDHDSGDGAVV